MLAHFRLCLQSRSFRLGASHFPAQKRPLVRVFRAPKQKRKFSAAEYKWRKASQLSSPNRIRKCISAGTVAWLWTWFWCQSPPPPRSPSGTCAALPSSAAQQTLVPLRPQLKHFKTFSTLKLRLKNKKLLLDAVRSLGTFFRFLFVFKIWFPATGNVETIDKCLNFTVTAGTPVHFNSTTDDQPT